MDALHQSILDALGTHTATSSEQLTVDNAVALVQDTVRAAVATFAYTWNQGHRDILLRLPLELRVDCLDLLHRNSLLSVSHVSRDWRATALSGPQLWNSFQFPRSMYRQDDILALLDTMLQRSSPGPFDFFWIHNVRMSSDVVALLTAHAARLRRVVVTGQDHKVLSSLLDRPMQLLQTLEAVNLYGPFKISKTWNDQSVPLLRALELYSIRLPPKIIPLRMITSLSLETCADCRHIFDAFPCVQTVELRGVTHSSHLPSEFPQSLLSFSMLSLDPDEDNSFHLRTSNWRRLQYMKMHSVDPGVPIHWFANGLAQRWNMAIKVLYDAGTTANIRMRNAEGHKLYVSTNYCDFRDCRFANSAGDLHHLTTLVLHEPHLLLHSMRDLTLSALTTLTFRMDSEPRTEDWPGDGENALSVPALEKLSFIYSVQHDIDVSRTMSTLQLIPSILTLGETPFETLLIVGRGVLALGPEEDFAFALEFCELVEFEDTALDHTEELPADIAANANTG
ncbi:hypothetical protein EXIGLDRAFT_776583 [Exidia glandulosa HHB12029]|uniref:F-box domain-containing protein n=1 Tax=Exidia glandulosa HHB12029 TaxID=1314781 RepID=A0A165DER1_EXIGL|nr:hypothetical protein EXIGLDRAFT_776583 [Exidia glandulosa HHB12029]